MVIYNYVIFLFKSSIVSLIFLNYEPLHKSIFLMDKILMYDKIGLYAI